MCYISSAHCGREGRSGLIYDPQYCSLISLPPLARSRNLSKPFSSLLRAGRAVEEVTRVTTDITAAAALAIALASTDGIGRLDAELFIGLLCWTVWIGYGSAISHEMIVS